MTITLPHGDFRWVNGVVPRIEIFEAQLTSGNIADGVDIYGVTGTARVATGSAAAAHVRTGKSFSNSTAVNIVGAMLDGITNGTDPVLAGNPIALSAFSGVQLFWYWSSATDADNPINAWFVNLLVGVVNHGSKSFNIHV